LPKNLRDAIWANYRPGQCDDWNITHGYAEAARNAVRFIANKDGVVPDVSVYDILDPKKSGAGCTCGADRTGPSAEAHDKGCPAL
jgi:hypothetical protein